MALLSNFHTRDFANKGVRVAIPNPADGTDTGFFITVLGKDSDAYRKAEAAQRDRAVRAANTTGSFKVTPEMIEQNSLELILCCMVSWEGLESEPGVPLPFSKEAAQDILKTCPFVREVVEKSIGDRTLFTGR